LAQGARLFGPPLLRVKSPPTRQVLSPRLQFCGWTGQDTRPPRPMLYSFLPTRTPTSDRALDQLLPPSPPSRSKHFTPSISPSHFSDFPTPLNYALQVGQASRKVLSPFFPPPSDSSQCWAIFLFTFLSDFEPGRSMGQAHRPLNPRPDAKIRITQPVSFTSEFFSYDDTYGATPTEMSFYVHPPPSLSPDRGWWTLSTFFLFFNAFFFFRHQDYGLSANPSQKSLSLTQKESDYLFRFPKQLGRFYAAFIAAK